MEQELEIEALVISSIPFKDFDRIVTLMSYERGLIKLFVKGANRPKSRKLALCQPLTHAKYILRKGRGDFYHLFEGKVIDAHLELRDSYKHLKAAFEILKALTKIHVEEHPSGDLFVLLKSYLNHLKSFDEPDVLVSSFYLKVLLYEGCLSLKPHCSRCKENSYPLYLCSKEYFCRNCAPYKQLAFSEEDLRCLLALIKERSFAKLNEHRLGELLHEKIKQLYQGLHEVSL